MAADSISKKKSLIISAGSLFAEHGYDKVTTRMIADKAGVRLSAIHYHFASKEELYIETFRYAHDKDNKVDFLEVLAEQPDRGNTAEGQAEIVRITVTRYFDNILNPSRPTWETQLLVREIVSPSSASPALAEIFIGFNVKNSEKFCQLIRPTMKSAERAIWADTLFSHLFLYILARRQIEAVRGEKWLSKDFFATAAKMIARYMILELDLPLPEELQKQYRY